MKLVSHAELERRRIRLVWVARRRMQEDCVDGHRSHRVAESAVACARL